MRHFCAFLHFVARVQDDLFAGSETFFNLGQALVSAADLDFAQMRASGLDHEHRPSL